MKTEPISRPYPFHLTQAIAQEPASLGQVEDWLFEWKWDGIRAQIIKRRGRVFICSRDQAEESIAELFPELSQAAARLSDGCVLDGEILAFKESDVLPFANLQARTAHKIVSKKILADVPVAFMAFDLLELDGQDIRGTVLEIRRQSLTNLLTPGACQSGAAASCRGALSPSLRVSPELEAGDWMALNDMQGMGASLKVAGIMIKRRHSLYGALPKRGDWWSWKTSRT